MAKMVESGRIVPVAGMRGLVAILFWIWALLGFFPVSGDFANLMAQRLGKWSRWPIASGMQNSMIS